MAIINKSIKTNPLILFSEYRAELMGIAIIGVLIGHTIILGNITINNTFIKFLNIIPRLAFTQGFLFLSGFGLCYSFTKNNNIKQFYLKRIKRLLIPFIILSAWYYLFQDLIENRNFIGFLMHISSLAFWIEGNYNGMWYIAISIVLYTIFPLCYKYIHNKRSGYKTALLILISIVFNIVLEYFQPEYYEKISIGIEKIPIFILGIYIGSLSLQDKVKKQYIITSIVIITIWIISYKTKTFWGYAYAIYDMTEKLIYMFIICIFLSMTNKYKIHNYLCKILTWFGRYSLELYVLHLLIFCFLSSNVLGHINPIIKVNIMLFGAIILSMPLHNLIDRLITKLKLTM